MGKIKLAYIAAIFSLAIACCPIVDHYCNWYITLLPIAFVLLSIKSKNNWNRLLTSILMAFIFSLFEYLTMHRQMTFFIQMRNNLIAFTPIIITVFIIDSEDKKFSKFYFQAMMVFMLITCVTTIIGLFRFPEASRELASSRGAEFRELYSLLNIGGFDFIYSIIPFLPLAFWMIKNTKGGIRVFNIFVFFVMLVCVYKSSYTIALVMSLLALVLILLDVKPKYKPFFIVLGVVLIAFMGTGLLSDFFLWLSNVVESEYVSDRLLQIVLVLNGTEISQISTSTTADRLELYQRAFNSFLNSPIWGQNIIDFNKNNISGHSIVLDTLGGSGLIGAIIVFLIFRKLFRTLVAPKGETVSPYVKISWIMFFFISMANPSGFMLIYMASFVICSIVQQLEYSNVNDIQ